MQKMLMRGKRKHREYGERYGRGRIEGTVEMNGVTHNIAYQLSTLLLLLLLVLGIHRVLILLLSLL